MKVREKFIIADTQYQQIAVDFAAQMAFGIQGLPSCFKMLPSYLPRACGQERGQYLSLDFGGTNVRAVLVELAGCGRVNIVRSAARPIPVQLTGSAAQAEQLFDFIAELIAEVAQAEQAYALGHTFSFPVRQTDINSGVLVEWAKEFATAGVVGSDINSLLRKALAARGLVSVQPQVLLNDTVATLLAASYTDKNTIIGSICGTGHNTAFFDPTSNMIINLEAGNFDLLPVNEYDLLLDAVSNNPGRQKLEKMTAGRYLGELFRLAVQREDFAQPFALDTQLLAEIICGQDARFDQVEQELAVAIVQRAASLVAASYAGVLSYLNLEPGRHYSIAIDGSLYEKMPLYAAGIRATLDRLMAEQTEHIRIFAESRGSSVGGAVAAALASKSFCEEDI